VKSGPDSGQYKVFLDNNGYIRLVMIGNFDGQLFAAMLKVAETLAEDLRSKGQRVVYLFDLTRIGKVSADGRRAGGELFSKIDYDATAAFGVSGILGIMIGFIGRVFPKLPTSHMFAHEEDALRHLELPKSNR